MKQWHIYYGDCEINYTSILLYILRAINIYMSIGKFSVFSLKSIFFLYHVAYYPKKIENNSQKNLATLRGMAGPHLFLAKVKMLKMFASNLFLYQIKFELARD